MEVPVQMKLIYPSLKIAAWGSCTACSIYLDFAPNLTLGWISHDTNAVESERRGWLGKLSNALSAPNNWITC